MRSGVPAAATRDLGLRLRLLGALTAELDGVVVNLGGRRQRAVLALLILARGGAVSADGLIDSVWGDQQPPSAPGALQAYVSHLRRRLEPQHTARSRGNVIISHGTGYALRVEPDAVDAWRFERLVREAPHLRDPGERIATLTEALALWRGPALADYTAEPWAQPDAARLTELREVAHEHLLAARLDHGDTALVVPELEERTTQHPLREERWRLLALALYRAGRQGDALAALRRARDILAAELGVDPGPALRGLEAEILAHSPALDLSPTAVAAPPALATAGPVPAVSARMRWDTGNLVDRERELAELRTCLDEAFEGVARVALVEGPAGIGKSRLLAEARRLAADHGALTLTARGSRLEKEYAFGAVRQLFEPVVTDPVARPALLAGAAASSTSVFDTDSPSVPVPRADGSFAVLHGLYWLTVNFADRRPLILTIDDLQWCDTGSLRFLAYLIRRLEGSAVLVVATLRTGEPHDDETLLDELTHDHATVRIRPSPLSPDGAAELIRGELGAADDAFVTACHRTTSGNPLLLRQLIRALHTEGVRPLHDNADAVIAIGSRAVSSMVLMRLRRLPPETLAVARAIAVVGDGATLPVVARLAELTEPAASGAIAALARAEVLRNDHPLGFVHPLVAEAVYRDLSPGERQLRHEHTAHVLADSGAAAQQVAAQLLQVPQRGDPWVVDVLRRAATVAADRGAADVAATYLRRALHEPAADRSGVLLELGRLETLGDGDAAAQHLREALDTLTEPGRRAEAATLLVRTLVFVGEPGESTAVAVSALASLPAEYTDERQCLQGLARMGGFMRGLPPTQWRHGEPEVSGAGPGARALAAALSWECLIDGVDRDRATRLARFAIADRTLLEADPGLLWVVAGNVLEMSDEDTGTFWDDADAYAHARGSLFSSLSIYLWRGYTQWRRGDLREAHGSFVTSFEQMHTWGPSIGAAYAESFAICTLLDLGRVAEARAMLERVRGQLRLADGYRLFVEAGTLVCLAEERYEAALAASEELPGLMPHVHNPVWRAWRSMRARALAGLGRVAEAIELVEEEIALARRWGAPTMIGPGLRLLGDLRGGDTGLSLLQESVAVLAPTRARLEYARSLYTLAKHSSTEGVATLLRDALQIAERCAARPLVRDIRTELIRAGLESPDARPAGATLTTTQRRIATMSADGLDEHEIAQAMFLTPRSVQRTLTAIRDALGAHSRDDLRRALVFDML